MALVLVACGGAPAAQPTTVANGHAHAHGHNASDHNHARGKMLLASDGTTNALLTAHLAKAGNELDIFFDRGEGNAVALPATAIIGKVMGSGDDTQPLRFECAPADERPATERPGTCSHYVAKAAWIKPGDTLVVTATVTVDGKDVPFTWREFNPHKYAHHEE